MNDTTTAPKGGTDVRGWRKATIGIKISDDELTAVRAAAARRGLTTSDYIRLAVDQLTGTHMADQAAPKGGIGTVTCSRDDCRREVKRLYGAERICRKCYRAKVEEPHPRDAQPD